MLNVNEEGVFVNEQHKKLFETFGLFRKLSFASILPDLSHGEYMTLLVVGGCDKNGRHKGIKVSTLAKKLNVSSPAVSRTIKGLEDRNFLVRTVDREDRRHTYVELTDEGRRVLGEAEKLFSEFSSSVLEKMGTKDMERLNSYLLKLYEVSKEEILLRKYRNGKEKEENE